MQKKILIILSLILGINLIITLENIACPIPVFRYALEYWETDPYRLEILYSNSLSAEEKKLVTYLKKSSEDREIQSNFKIRTVDIESGDHDIPQSFLENISTDKRSCMVVRYPFVSGKNIVLWSADLTGENISLLLDSPLRQSIAGKLVSDATAVWIFLESGDKRKDGQALEMVEKELIRLEQTLTFPNPEMWLGNYQDNADNNEPMVDFEVIKVSRDDPREQFLIKMLLDSEADLNDFDSEPIVFPIFGRGIILYGIVGKGINEWNIREAAEFITGECSCQAKLLNPGIDMLISMNWDREIKRITDPGIANPLTGIGDFGNKEEKARRLLDSVTLEHIGKLNENPEGLQTDPEKVVYLDIFGNKEQNTENENTISDSNTSSKSSTGNKIKKYNNKGKESPKEISAGEIFPDNGKSAGMINESQKRKSFGHTMILTFSLIILIVLISGIIIYFKAIK